MEQPSYYAVVIAPVRYCNELTANAKLLYGEITALADKYGYCWASNAYFANLYGVTETSITNWVKQLEKLGFVKVELIKHRQDNGQFKSERRIYVGQITATKYFEPPKNIFDEPPKNILGQNNTSNSNTTSKSKEKNTKKENLLEEINRFTNDDRLRESLCEWVEERKAMKKPLTLTALRKNLTTLSKLSPTDGGKVAVVDQTIANGWAGFYPLRTSGVAHGTPPQSEHKIDPRVEEELRKAGLWEE